MRRTNTFALQVHGEQTVTATTVLVQLVAADAAVAVALADHRQHVVQSVALHHEQVLASAAAQGGSARRQRRAAAAGWSKMRPRACE